MITSSEKETTIATSLTIPDVRRADNEANTFITALDFVREPPEVTRNTPLLFRCTTGHYWLKPLGYSSKEGACTAELISGRLASMLDVGPHAEIVNVPPEAIDNTSSNQRRFIGLCVGVKDIPNTKNVRELQPYLTNNMFDLSMVDQQSWMEVIAFQAWISMRDWQVLINLATGQIYSFDHEDSVCNYLSPTPQVSAPPILTTQPNKINYGGIATAMASKIAHMDESCLLKAIAMPNCNFSERNDQERLDIANTLHDRGINLQVVVEHWVKS